MSTALHGALDVSHLQALPVELQDMILDLLLNDLPRNTTILINQEYCSPWQLFINRATRRKAAQDYYGKNNFTWESPGDKFLISWLTSLELSHISLMKELRLPPLSCPDSWSRNPGSVTWQKQVEWARSKLMVVRVNLTTRTSNRLMDSVRLTTKIDDKVDRWYSEEEVEEKCRSYGWHVHCLSLAELVLATRMPWDTAHERTTEAVQLA